MTPRIAVLGNGAAGALVVTSLLRDATRTGTLLDLAWVGDGEPGRGVAYATPHRWHRLNAPAADMSLDEADLSFPAWLAARGRGEERFAARHDFGTYLVETLDAARAAAGPTVALTEHRDRAVSCHGAGGGLRVTLREGAAIEADTVVLALGPFDAPPPSDLPPERTAGPWDGTVERLPDGETVLLVGTGLTMVDAALTVARRAPAARMVAVSRSGLLPRDHTPDEGPAVGPAVVPHAGLELDELVAGVEDAVGAHNGRWRDVVDGLRPATPALWQALAHDERRRFLDEHARRWEIHRHRMAPQVADELGALRAEERLRLHDGGLRGVERAGSRLRATLGDTDHDVDRAIACTGGQDDVAAVDDPLVRSLLDGGLAHPHPLGLGFDTGAHGAMLGTGAPVYGIGTLRRGERYETTAIPEIREQAVDLARHLLGVAS